MYAQCSNFDKAISAANSSLEITPNDTNWMITGQLASYYFQIDEIELLTKLIGENINAKDMDGRVLAYFSLIESRKGNKQLAKKTNSKFALATIYNTVHSFKNAGHISEVEVRGNKTYFDTNVSNHHHFYDSETSELIDIDASEVIIQKIPKAPNGKKIKNVEVFINLKN